ncbi:WG repeat-containing protein [Ammoniphilus resinae]|nr:WG repeat-containing protein [Ammoniphilus resinae]
MRRAIYLFPASVRTTSGVKWGYINNQGRFFIPPQFDGAENFQPNGLAVVQVNNRSGLMNVFGQWVVRPKYEMISSFSEGRAQVIDQGKFKVIDERGNEITTKSYEYIGSYTEGRAQAADTREGKYLYGYLDLQGREIIPVQYESATDFTSGRATVQKPDEEYVLIDSMGKILQTYKYPFVGSLGDGLLPFKQTSDGKYGYIDQTGTVVISPQYTWAQPFQHGRAIVNISNDYKNKYGLIDKNGNYLIEPKYNDILFVSSDRVAVGKPKDEERPYMGSNYSLADTAGHFLTGFVFREISEYVHEYASANTDQNTFFINRTGQVARKLPILPGSGTLAFVGDLIRADVDQRVSYYNYAGQLVWRQNSVVQIHQGLLVREGKYKPNKDYLVYYPQIEGMQSRSAQAKVNQRLKELSQVVPITPNTQLDYSYTGDFSIFFSKKNLLEFELDGYHFPFGAAHGMPSRVFAPVDLVTGEVYQLRDLFIPGSDYVKVISDIIANQIKNDPQYSYVFPNTYKGIKVDQPFYVKDEALYIYFLPYEIAPFAAGFPTFKIPFKEIGSMIDMNGAFWRSFH